MWPPLISRSTTEFFRPYRDRTRITIDWMVYLIFMFVSNSHFRHPQSQFNFSICSCIGLCYLLQAKQIACTGCHNTKYILHNQTDAELIWHTLSTHDIHVWFYFYIPFSPILYVDLINLWLFYYIILQYFERFISILSFIFLFSGLFDIISRFLGVWYKCLQITRSKIERS